MKWNPSLCILLSYHDWEEGNFCKNIWEIHHFPPKASPNPLIFKYFPFEVPNHLPCWFSLFRLLIGLTQPNPHLPVALNVSPENLSITFINFMILYRFRGTAISVCRWYSLHSHYDVGAQNILQNSDSPNNNKKHFDKRGRKKLKYFDGD